MLRVYYIYCMTYNVTVPSEIKGAKYHQSSQQMLLTTTSRAAAINRSVDQQSIINNTYN